MEYILNNHLEKTPEQISLALLISVRSVKEFCEDNNLETKKPVAKKAKKNHTGTRTHKVVVFAEVEKKFERPKAIYTNLPSPMGIASEMMR